jgi:type I restriction enzyme S subunit
VFGDHTRETKLIDFDFVVGAEGVKLLHPVSLFARYYFLALQWLPIKSRGYGRHYKLLRQSSLPLPPLAEQHRIVAKVDELMALCDRLEAAQSERESWRDRLAVAVHASLSNSSSSIPHSTFFINYLQRLTTKTEHIQQLRQTILNLAVRGKLVHQDPNDEPATLLLERLAADAKTYAHEHGIVWPKLEPIQEECIAFLAPSGWEWVRLSSLFKVITDGDHQPPPKTERGIAFLTIGNITTGRLDFANCRFVAKEYVESLPAYRKPNFGDILYTVVGATYGRPAYVDSEREFCVQRHIAILKPTDEVNVRFLCFLLASALVFEQATRSITGTAQPTIPLRPLRNFIVPLPPLAEQHRIVAKVDELMTLCDRLEAQLTTSQTESRRLLEAILHEALAPAA